MPTITQEEKLPSLGAGSTVDSASSGSTSAAPATVRVSVGNSTPRPWHDAGQAPAIDREHEPKCDRHPLYWLRHDAGLSRSELAHKVGSSERMIYSYEIGQFQPPILLAFRLAFVLGVTVDKLFGIPYKKLARQASE